MKLHTHLPAAVLPLAMRAQGHVAPVAASTKALLRRYRGSTPKPGDVGAEGAPPGGRL